MHPGLLNMFHHATNKGLARHIPDAIDIALYGVIQKSVKQDRRVVADLHRLAHVALQVALFVHDLHGTTTQHIAGSHHQGIAQSCRFVKSF